MLGFSIWMLCGVRAVVKWLCMWTQCKVSVQFSINSLPCNSNDQFTREQPQFLVQLMVVGDDIEDRVAPSYAMVLEDFVDVF